MAPSDFCLYTEEENGRLQTNNLVRLSRGQRTTKETRRPGEQNIQVISVYLSVYKGRRTTIFCLQRTLLFVTFIRSYYPSCCSSSRA